MLLYQRRARICVSSLKLSQLDSKTVTKNCWVELICVVEFELSLRQSIKTTHYTLLKVLRGHPHITSYSSRFNVLAKSLFNRQIELNTKNSTKQQQSCRLVELLVFNSIHQLIRLPFEEVYGVGDGGPDHAVHPHITSYT